MSPDPFAAMVAALQAAVQREGVTTAATDRANAIEEALAAALGFDRFTRSTVLLCAQQLGMAGATPEELRALAGGLVPWTETPARGCVQRHAGATAVLCALRRAEAIIPSELFTTYVVFIATWWRP